MPPVLHARLGALALLLACGPAAAQTVTVRLDAVRIDESLLFGGGTGAPFGLAWLVAGAPAGMPAALDSVQHARIGLAGVPDTLTVAFGVGADGRWRMFAGSADQAPLEPVGSTVDSPGVVTLTDSSGAPVAVDVSLSAARSYVFYRRLDVRVGTAEMGGTARAVALAHSPDASAYRIGRALRLMVDVDGDGAFAPVRRGQPSEVVAVDAPFRVGDRAYRLVSVAPDGAEATFEPVDVDTEALAVGFRMPDVALVRPDGTPARLSDLRGQVVVINWWADSCGPCYGEMPGLSDLADAYAGRDVAFVAIARNTRDELAQALDGRTFTYQQTVAADTAAAGALLGDGFPRHVVLDAEGRVVFDMLGGSPRIHEMLAPVVEPLVAVVREDE